MPRMASGPCPGSSSLTAVRSWNIPLQVGAKGGALLSPSDIRTVKPQTNARPYVDLSRKRYQLRRNPHATDKP